MKIILIRHGETHWNAIQKYQGHTDIPLNERGRQQAARLAAYLKAAEQVEAVYCSDLLRARETALIVARPFQIEPVSDRRLREFHFGKWEGLTFNQVYAGYRYEFEQWFNNPEDFRVPEGESFSDLARRSLQAIEDVSRKHAGTTLIVTHGGVIKVMLCQLQSISNPWQETVPPGSLTEINVIDGRMQIQHFGVVV